MTAKDKTSTNLVYRLSSTVILFLITILISRISGPGTFGILSLFVLNATFLNLITSFGSESSIIFHRANGSMTNPKLLRFIYTLLAFQTMISIVVVVVFAFIGELPSLLGGGEVGYWWLWCIYLLAISVIEKYGAIMNGSQLYTLYSRITLVVNGIFLGALFVLYIYDLQMDVFAFISVYVLFNFLHASVLFIEYSRRTSFRSSFLSRPEYRTLFKYSTIVFMSNMVQFLAYRAGVWMIDWYSTDVQLGLFAFANKMSQLIWLLSVVYATLLFPRVSRESPYFDSTSMLMFIRIMNIINVILILIGVLTLKWLLPMVVGDEFSGSVIPVLLLLPGTAMFCITNVLASYFAGSGKLTINLYGSAFCLMSVLILNFVFIPIWGINGAALAASIAYSLSTVYSIAVYL